ncbi:MAG: hypothetical protein EXQ47_03230 [Bryobacterales bacterium]|nr:hypothetical protein [Bryobacterales bacterium]
MKMGTWAMMALAAASPLLAQQEQDVVFTRAAPIGMAAMGVGAGMGGTFNFVAGELVGGAPVKNAPYSAEAATENVQVLADGNRIVHKTTAVVYRDSQGRERREQSLPAIGPFAAQGVPPKTIFISDPVAGVNYSLDVQNKIAIKLPHTPMAPGKLMDLPAPPKEGGQVFIRHFEGPAPAAGVAMAAPQAMFFRHGPGAPGAGAGTGPQGEQLGSKVIEGISADGVRHNITIPAGQIGNERPIEIADEIWRSPELQVIVQSTHSDPRMGTMTYSLRNTSRAEPAAMLFQVPPDYTLRDAPRFVRPFPAQ